MAVPEAAALGSGPGAAGAEPPEALGLLELCGACRQRLSPQREPRLLPCLHSVCRRCLGSGPAAPGGDGSAFECPVCHQQCPLGDIMENLFLQGGTGGQSCTSCEDNATATSFCLECSEPLCATCVGAHLRVRYTREHRVQPLDSLSVPSSGSGADSVPGSGSVPGPVPDPNPDPGSIPGSVPDGVPGSDPDPDPVPDAVPAPFPSRCLSHPREPLSLFCSACDALTCRQCHRGPHRHHPSQPLAEAVFQQRSLLSALLQRLAQKHSELQRCTRELHACSRRVSDAQKRLQVEVKLAILQVMRELNKRAQALVGDVQVSLKPSR
ncbi:transcription intermediary factor 1-beta-like [Serinus canaria]|uniref:transcription intermediary factor 1-beta-like n=1 Tax=Serinus canaria TaxID=9135 RepID=UPI0021CC6C12|nr:transcription intermediary factor 1-beta-like [Serinus canaria]